MQKTKKIFRGGVEKCPLQNARRTRTAGIFSILNNLDNFQKIVYF